MAVFVGGLGSYTPSKSQMSESVFQLGLSREQNIGEKYQQKNKSSVTSPSSPSSPETILLPTDDGVSWGSSASSDMLF